MATTTPTVPTFAQDCAEALERYRGKALRGIVKADVVTWIGDIQVEAYFAQEDLDTWRSREFVLGVMTTPSRRTGGPESLWFETAHWDICE